MPAISSIEADEQTAKQTQKYKKVMALSTKNSRPITVNGTHYRWAIAPDSGYVTLVVEQSQGKGQRIAVQILTDIHDFWTEFPNVKGLNLKVVTPKVVRQCILEALCAGWKPAMPGTQMDFDLLEDYTLKRRR